MKTPLIIALLFVAGTAFAQKDTVGLKIPYADGTVVYEKVFDTPGIKKAALFSNSQVWFIQRYTGRDIVLLDTSLAKIVEIVREPLSFKGPLNINVPCIARMTVQVDCKDNKYRCRFYKISISTDRSYTGDKIETTPEELVTTLTGNGTLMSLNKNQARRLLESLNAMVSNTMASLFKTMSDKNDF